MSEHLYECDRNCGWVNDDFRYGFADAGASWAMHMYDHRKRDADAASTADGADE
jgi:hypothetical protein